MYMKIVSPPFCTLYSCSHMCTAYFHTLASYFFTFLAGHLGGELKTRLRRGLSSIITDCLAFVSVLGQAVAAGVGLARISVDYQKVILLDPDLVA